MTDKTGHYRVDYEYARMREVVLGGTNGAMGARGTVVGKYIEELYPDEDTREFMRSIQGTPVSKAHPAYHQRLVDETDALAAVYEKYGVIVHRTEPYTEEVIRLCGSGGYADVFAKDAFETVGHFFFDLAHKKHLYRYFWTASRSILQQAFMDDPEMRFLSFPHPFPTRVDEGYGSGPFFEGGDIIVLPGNKVLMGESGQASDEFGEAILTRFLDTIGYELITIKLHPNMLHLDCCVTVIGPDTILYCPETFIEGLPTVLADAPNKVETTLLDAQRLLNNAVVIDSDTVVIDARLEGKQGAELEALGKTVEYIEFSAHAPLGGALRCKTGVLSRYDN